MYVKLFKSLWQGSLVGQSGPQLVFIYLLANCDPAGFVDIHPRVIASLTGLSEDEVRQALNILESPDPSSRSESSGGARLERIDAHRDWGWQVINYKRYRSLKDAETIREQTRERVSRHREMKRSVTHGNAVKQQGEVEVEVEVEEDTDSKHLSGKPDARVRKTRREAEPGGFAEFYAAFPRRDGRRAAATAFTRALKRLPTYQPKDLADAAALFATQCQDESREPRFIPMPATWLNQDRFREFFDEEEDRAQTPIPQA